MFRWNGSIILLERKFGGLSSSPGNKGSQTYKIKNSKRAVDDGKREKAASLLLLFPLPILPARFLFPLSSASLRHQKASGSLWGGQKFHRVRLTEAQAQWDPRRAQWNEPTVCRCQSKDGTFSHIHGWTKTSLTKKSVGSITWFTEKSWQFTL